jgi:hypothetical protein
MKTINDERNAEILFMGNAGIPHKHIAAHFGLSMSTVRNIIWRGRSGDAGLKKTKVPLTATYRPGARPRLRKASSGLWECSDGVVERAGRTFQGAYQRWLTAAIAEAQDQLQAEA